MDLALQDLTLAYGTHTVLDRVSLRLQGIHALVLIGPSGGGKSTLLRLLAGLARPTAGGIELDGVPLPFPGPGDEDTEGLRQHRTRTGFVFQGHNLFPHLTALENVTLPLIQVHGRTRAEATEEASALLERFRLGRHARQRPAELSGGQQQRVAIARAAAVKPRWLLFDEPTSALDPEMTAEVLDMIAELRAEGRDLVLATHQMGFARRVADHAAFVGDGGIPAHGPTKTFFGEDAPPRVRAFLERVLAY